MDNELEYRITKLEKEMRSIKKEIEPMNKMIKFFRRMLCNEEKENNDKKYLEKIKKLEKLLVESQDENSKWAQILKEKNNEIDNLNNYLKKVEIKLLSLEKQKEKIEMELDNSYLKTLKKLFDELDEETKSILKFPNEERELFVRVVIDFGFLYNLLEEYIREKKFEQFMKLKKFYDFVAPYYIKANGYHFQEIGEKFDMDLYIRDNRSVSTSGNIDEVVLRGIVDENGNIIRKSIVKVK